MDNLFDTIIIGGGPAGLSAGLYAARAKFRVLILEKSDIGGQIKTTSEVVNYPGVGKTSGASLTESMRKQAVYFGAQIVSANVIDVDFTDEIKVIKTDKGEYKGFGIIIATGANPRAIGFKGEIEFKGRGVAYCATCDGEFFTGLDVFVVGAGFAAAEEAMFLTRYARKVTIIAREPEFTCAKSIADKVLAHKDIEVRFNTEVEEIGGDINLKYAKFINNVSGERTEYKAEDNSTFGVFVFAGYIPASDVVKGHVELDNGGYIITNSNLMTNVKGVYAAGDVCIKTLRQVVTAVSDGAVAATNLERYVEELANKYGVERKENTTRSEEELQKESYEQVSEETDEEDAFITSDMKEKLEPIFSRMEKKVKVVTILDHSKEVSNEVKGFAGEISNLTDKISVEIYEKGENPRLEEAANIDLYPALVICSEENEYLGVAFHGVPGGHEFNSFILALYNASGPGQKIDLELLNRIKDFNKKVDIKIAISLSCTMCPEVVTGAQRIALENKNVTARMLDLAHYEEIKKKYSIMSVPCMIINDEKVVFGRKSIEDILKEINL